MKRQGNRKPRISQCMIVRDEEKNIERALSWGKSIMWEQIVVDTGSTDRTVGIAEKLGAKVYHFDWLDDFSAAKNYAIDQAKGDWIVFLDADEYMNAKDAEGLHRLLADIEMARAPYLAVYAAIWNLREDGSMDRMGSHLRFFRNRPKIRYEGRVHEHIENGEKGFGDSELLDASEELAVIHTGYTETVFQETGKLERNERLLKRELTEHPDDVYMLGYLAQNYSAMGKYDLALEWYEKAVRAFEASGHGTVKQDEHISRLFSRFLYYLGIQGAEPERLLKIYEKAIRAVTGECDFDYVMGIYFLEKQDWERVIYHLERALKLLEENGNLFFGEMLTRDLPRMREYLAISCFNGGKREKCMEHCILFLKEDRFAMGILKVLLRALQSDLSDLEGAKQLLEVLGKIYDLSVFKDRLFIQKAVREMGYETLEQVIWGLFSPQEQELLKGRI